MTKISIMAGMIMLATAMTATAQPVGVPYQIKPDPNDWIVQHLGRDVVIYTRIGDGRMVLCNNPHPDFPRTCVVKYAGRGQ